MVFDGFGVWQPLVTMVSNGCQPLVQQYNGYLTSLKSKLPIVYFAQMPIKFWMGMNKSSYDSFKFRPSWAGSNLNSGRASSLSFHIQRKFSISRNKAGLLRYLSIYRGTFSISRNKAGPILGAAHAKHDSGQVEDIGHWSGWKIRPDIIKKIFTNITKTY